MNIRKSAISIVLAGLFSGAVYSQEGPFVANLRGSEEVPPVESMARGVALFQLNEDSTQVTYRLSVHQAGQEEGPRLTEAHLHCAPQGETGPVVVDLLGLVRGGVTAPLEVSATMSDANIISEEDQTAEDGTTCSTAIGTPVTTLAELLQAIEAGNIYVNVHSEQNPEGEIRGQIVSITAGEQPTQPPGEEPTQPPGEEPTQPPGEQPAE